MNKQEMIKEIKKDLQRGLKLQVITSGRFKMNLWLSDDNKYIMYRCYRQSAVKNNLKDLTWLINNILNAKRKSIEYRIIGSVIE